MEETKPTYRCAFFRRRVIRDELESSEKREQLCVQDYENRCVPCPVRITVLVLSRLSAISFYSMLLVSATARHLTTELDIGSRIAAFLGVCFSRPTKRIG